MYNIHLGAPSLLSSSVHRLAEIASGDGDYTFEFVDEQKVTELVTPYVDAETENLTEPPQLIRIAAQYLSHTRNLGQIFVFYPGLLGTRAHYFRSGKSFPHLDSRVARLNALFQGREARLHLLIVSQVDFIMYQTDIPLEKRLKGIIATKLSWANVVWRTLRAAPNRNLIVWNVEKPRTALMSYFDSITPFASENARIMVANELNASNLAAGDLLSFDKPEGLEDAILRLDDQYEVDLAKIALMPRATLMSF